MGIAKVAIVGRPNVGKSSIFNWLAGEKISIVDSVAGVTRDRVSVLLPLDGEEADSYVSYGSDQELKESVGNGKSNKPGILAKGGKGIRTEAPPAPVLLSEEAECELETETMDRLEAEAAVEFEESLGNGIERPSQSSLRFIELIDTGGIGIVDKDDLSEDVEAQIRIALDSADLILFVTDVRAGIAPLDQIVAEKLRPLSIPVILVANKTDDDKQEKNAEEFHQFGWKMVKVSAKQKIGRIRLMDEIEKTVPPEAFNNDGLSDESVMKISIVGRRNVGKSTFVNTLVQEERVIASPVPGTTRDCVDVRFEWQGHVFTAIDTPGFMRGKSIGSDLDFYALTRARRSIRRADVVLMFFDCSQRISKMDKQLVNLIEEHMRPMIFVVNKWDLMAPHMPTSRWGDYLRETFAQCWYVPIAFVTGMTGKNVDKLLRHARMLQRQYRMRIPTSRINKIITAALDYNPPPLYYHRKPKIYYAVQAGMAPPTIVLFCNMPDAFSSNYKHYLLGVLRDELPIGEVPIRLVFRKREEKDAKDEIDSKRKS